VLGVYVPIFRLDTIAHIDIEFRKARVDKTEFFPGRINAQAA
jgi:hypothetical protein